MQKSLLGDMTGSSAASSLAGPGTDPLLACLAYVVRSYGLPFSTESALAALPLPADGRLDLANLLRAAAQLGCKAETAARAPSRIPGLLLPVVVLLADHQAAVLTARDEQSGSGTILMPDVSAAPRSISLAELDRQALHVVLISRDEGIGEAAGRPTSGRHWFWSIMLALWPSWCQVAVSALLINILGLAVPVFVMSVYDRVIPNQSLPTLWALTSGVLLALLFELALKQLRAAILDQASGLVEMAATSRLFRQALALPLSQRGQSPGALAAQVREFETVREFFASSSIAAFIDLLFVGLVVAVMYALVGSLAFVALAALPIVIALTLLFQWPLSRGVKMTQAEGTRRHAILIESLAAIETVKSISAEGYMQRRWEEAVAASVRAMGTSRTWSALNINVIGLVQQLVGVIVVVWGVFQSMEGLVTVGGIIAASMLSGRVLGPISSIAMVVARWQSALSAMGSLNALMRAPAENTGSRAGSPVLEGSLEFREVTFTYPQSPVPALSGLSFKIAPGERVGLLGRVGSGKSTLAKLAAGLWQAEAGNVLVGGQESRSLEAAEIRAAVSLMGQDTELFSGSLYDNLVMGLRNPDEAAIRTACEVSGVAEFASRSPMGLRLPVGERGRALSGGQRQAVALARALLRRPRILILDEPSSALDTASELDVVRRLEAWVEAQGTTLIVSSQRLAMLDACDRLIVLDQGRLVADGPKADVLKRLAARGG